MQNSLLKCLKDGNVITMGGLGVGYPRKLRHVECEVPMGCFYNAVRQAAGSLNRELAVRLDVIGVGLGAVGLEAEWTVMRHVGLLVSSGLAQGTRDKPLTFSTSS